MVKEGYYIAALQGVSGFGGQTIRQLVAHFGEPQHVWTANREALRASGYLTADTVEGFVAYRKKFSFSALERQLADNQIFFTTYLDERFPTYLQDSVQAPAILFYQGQYANDTKSLAIIGARSGTAYGQQIARDFATKLATRGVTIVSGGARGIDTCAHEGALAGGGRTIAVMGGGLDRWYPRENKRLFQKIRDTGMLVSEYLPGMPAKRENFPARNRIIAGLVRGVVVVEAKTRSGTLITVDKALQDGRDVFAVPGSISNPYSEGCHWLLRQGAIPVTKPEHLWQEYGWFSDRSKKIHSQEGQPMISLNFEETSIIEALRGGEVMTVDCLMAITEIPLSRLTMYLVQLEMHQVIAHTDTGGYVLIPRR